MPKLPPKLHLNEHLSPRLAVQLRQYGFNVTCTLESGMVSEDDARQLAHAVSEQRAIVTFNHKDFVTLHRQYMAEHKEHWGIIFSTEESVDVLRRRLLRLLNTISAEELRNQIRWLNEFR
jgi:predicted nuclease of predicted toxin-antitoxin system